MFKNNYDGEAVLVDSYPHLYSRTKGCPDGEPHDIKVELRHLSLISTILVTSTTARHYKTSQPSSLSTSILSNISLWGKFVAYIYNIILYIDNI